MINPMRARSPPKPGNERCQIALKEVYQKHIFYLERRFKMTKQTIKNGSYTIVIKTMKSGKGTMAIFLRNQKPVFIPFK